MPIQVPVIAYFPSFRWSEKVALAHENWGTVYAVYTPSAKTALSTNSQTHTNTQGGAGLVLTEAREPLF